MVEQKDAIETVSITRTEYEHLVECRTVLDAVKRAYDRFSYDTDRLSAALEILCCEGEKSC